MAILVKISPSLLSLCHQAIKLANPPRSQMNMFVEIIPSYVKHEQEPKDVKADSGVYVEFYRRRIGSGWVLNGSVEDIDDATYCQVLVAKLSTSDQDK